MNIYKSYNLEWRSKMMKIIVNYRNKNGKNSELIWPEE